MDHASSARATRARRSALLVFAGVAMLLAACAPLTRPDPTQTVTLTPEARNDIMIVRLPLDLPAGGVTVVPARRPTFFVPLSHVPPPGTCRVWLPEAPLRSQPPPGPCRELEERVPPEGYLLVA